MKLNDYKTVEYPTTLYKYRDWSNSLHKKILTEGVLYLEICLKKIKKRIS